MLRLLIIEDDPLIAKLVCQLACDAGFETKICVGKTSIAVYDQFRPDAVVLDLLMPEIDGFEVLQHLSSRKSFSRIVIITGGGTTFRHMGQSLAEGLKLRLEATVMKPFDPVNLSKILSRLHDSILSERPVAEVQVEIASLPRMNSN